MATAHTIQLATAPAFTDSGQRSLAVAIGAGLLAGVIFFNEAVFRVSDAESFSFDWQVALRLALCVACGLYGLWFLPQTRTLLLRFPAACSLLFVAWTFASVPGAEDPKFAAAAVGTLACVTLFAPAVLLQLGPERVVKVALVGLLLFLLASWGVYFFVPGMGLTEQLMPDGEVNYRFGGLTHPNSLGRQAALCFGLLLVQAYEGWSSWKKLLPAAVFALATLLATDCRTALVAALAVATWYAWRRLSLQSCVAIACCLATSLALFALLSEVNGAKANRLLDQLSRTGDADEMYSLTGRTEVWEYAWEHIARSPLAGCGHGCTRFIMSHNFFATHHAHNLLLNVMLGCGIVGGLLLAGMMLFQLAALFRRPNAFPDVVTVLVLVGGIADYMMLGPIPDSHTMLWLIGLSWREADSRRWSPSFE